MSCPKRPIASPMLSLDKTKEVGVLQEWLGDAERASLLETRRSDRSTDL